MNNVTLFHADVVGIMQSPRVKPKTYLWFVVTHAHLLLKSFNDCSIVHIELQTLKTLDKQDSVC